MAMSDERFQELWNATPSADAIARGMTAPAAPRHQDSRHAHYIAIRTDEVLYRAGILTAEQCHRDCDLSATPDAKLLVRDMLSLGGIRVSDENTLEFYRAAMTSSDLPLLLENIGAKALTLGYRNAPESWPLWTRTTTTKDFRAFTRPTAPTWPTPPETAENAAIPYASLDGATAERGAVRSFAEVLAVSRETLVNDDLGSFALAANAAGVSISRLIGDLSCAVLTANALMSDSVALFDASHGNEGTAAAPSVVMLDEMFSLMAAQTGPRGESLNLRPRFIIGPPSLNSTLSVLRGAINQPDPSGLSTGNVTTLTDSRLAGTAWYGVADPNQVDGIQVIVLEGSEDRPRFERKNSARLNSDRVEFIIGYDVHVMATDYRSLARNAGV